MKEEREDGGRGRVRKKERRKNQCGRKRGREDEEVRKKEGWKAEVKDRKQGVRER